MKEYDESRRKIWSPGNDGSQFDNFYTPQNGKFYSESPYHHLDEYMEEIRLLRLCITQSHDKDLKFDLVDNIPLEDAEHYWAISYRAGDPNDTKVIEVDGLKFNIFASAFDALQKIYECLKKHSEEGNELSDHYVWVDQVCIDQSDHRERSAQVTIMRQIYERATEVLVRLGPDPTDDMAMDWLLSQYRQLQIICRGPIPYLEGRDLVSTVNRFHFQAVVDSLQSRSRPELLSLLGALAEFMSQPWWTRCWVAQELVVARRARIVYGGIAVEWDRFTIAISSLEHVLPWLINSGPRPDDWTDSEVSVFKPFVHSLKTLRVLHFFRKTSELLRTSPTVDLKALLEHSRGCRSSDPRDRIYAFLPLTGHIYGIEVDYTPQNTIENLLIHTAVRVILTEERLDILSHLEPDARSADSPLPTWVPEWSYLEVQNRSLLHVNARLATFPFFDSTPFDASNGQPTKARFVRRSPDSRGSFDVLRVWGIVVDNVSRVDTFGEPESIEGQEMWCTKWVSVVSGRMIQNFADSIYMCVCDVLGLGVGVQVAVTESQDSLEEFGGFLKNWIDGRRFVVSPKGWVGLVSRGAEPSDYICILQGARIPFILRKVGSYYTIIGEAYIHGLMHGRAAAMVGDGYEYGVLDII
ncbi:hypothetical protein MAPG_09091 [Magnaporthiopsis poae ATCC 64411]|uniref:Heterokaryon incompatibility domain-containing protein n=1 Tax=Magnaporthiopsis poae (strain ATCC 64411 / 73-15) TaxID=644358 RepID=A0A0C4E915_MAGP6|nr:hypothetical protein MAPG_09091 [Magnaporthiopsis poae ATCC 64411]